MVSVTSSRILQESQIECCEYRDNSYIHQEPFPEPVSEKQEIHSDHRGSHHHDVKYNRYLSSHWSPRSKYKLHFEYAPGIGDPVSIFAMGRSASCNGKGLCNQVV
jgi:hypothetical protein